MGKDITRTGRALCLLELPDDYSIRLYPAVYQYGTNRIAYRTQAGSFVVNHNEGYVPIYDTAMINRIKDNPKSPLYNAYLELHEVLDKM